MNSKMNTQFTAIPFSPITTTESVIDITSSSNVNPHSHEDVVPTKNQRINNDTTSFMKTPSQRVKSDEAEVHVVQQLSLSPSSSSSPENNHCYRHYPNLRKDQFTRFQKSRYSSSTATTLGEQDNQRDDCDLSQHDNDENVNDCNHHPSSSTHSAFMMRLTNQTTDRTAGDATIATQFNQSEEIHKTATVIRTGFRRMVSNDIQSNPSDERDDCEESVELQNEIVLNNESNNDLNQGIIQDEGEETQDDDEEETEEELRKREEEESEALARQLMAEEAMASYAQSSNYLRAHANEYSEEDLRALEALMAEEDPMTEQGGEEEFDDEDDESGELSYETLLRLGERIGDVKTERWSLKAKEEIEKLKIIKFDHNMAKGKDENDCCVKCLVCQFQYEEGETLRVLPCKHR